MSDLNSDHSPSVARVKAKDAELAAAAMVTAAKVFIPIWLGAALFNMWMGVSRAGYSVAEELPIFLAIFAIPAGVAVFVWWKFS